MAENMKSDDTDDNYAGPRNFVQNSVGRVQ